MMKSTFLCMDLFFNESESGAFLFCFAYFMQNVIANDKKFLFLAFTAHSYVSPNTCLFSRSPVGVAARPAWEVSFSAQGSMSPT